MHERTFMKEKHIQTNMVGIFNRILRIYTWFYLHIMNKWCCHSGVEERNDWKSLLG